MMAHKNTKRRLWKKIWRSNHSYSILPEHPIPDSKASRGAMILFDHHEETTTSRVKRQPLPPLLENNLITLSQPLFRAGRNDIWNITSNTNGTEAHPPDRIQFLLPAAEKIDRAGMPEMGSWKDIQDKLTPASII
ncbi:MAG: hypothetical protein ACLRS8_14605 [Parabacteroides merdae]